MKFLNNIGISGVCLLAAVFVTPANAEPLAGVGAKTGAAIGAVSGDVKIKKPKKAKKKKSVVKGQTSGAAVGAILPGSINLK